MEKIKKWIKNNKGLAVIVALTIVLLIILLIIFLQMVIGRSSSSYGNRLDGMDAVKIGNDVFDGIKEELKETGLVEESSIRRQGKIIYTTIVLKSDTSKDKAKEIASNTLESYKEEELKYYDFSFFLKWKGEEADTVVIGNKHHDLDKITWTNN